MRRFLCCFRRLAAVQASFEDWVVLGKVDMGDLIATHCKTYEDFERNFKMVKLKGQCGIVVTKAKPQSLLI